MTKMLIGETLKVSSGDERAFSAPKPLGFILILTPA